MDTSETYIKMCECEEIQAIKVQYLHGHGNYFADSATQGTPWLISCDVCFDFTKEPDRFIWLPCQDQLQEMVFDHRISAIFIVHEVDKFALTIPKVKIGKDMKANLKLSMEQLWLAFVMKEKYNKVWDGLKWLSNGSV